MLRDLRQDTAQLKKRFEPDECSQRWTLTFIMISKTKFECSDFDSGFHLAERRTWRRCIWTQVLCCPFSSQYVKSCRDTWKNIEIKWTWKPDSCEQSAIYIIVHCKYDGYGQLIIFEIDSKIIEIIKRNGFSACEYLARSRKIRISFCVTKC